MGDNGCESVSAFASKAEWGTTTYEGDILSSVGVVSSVLDFNPPKNPKVRQRRLGGPFGRQKFAILGIYYSCYLTVTQIKPEKLPFYTVLCLTIRIICQKGD